MLAASCPLALSMRSAGEGRVSSDLLLLVQRRSRPLDVPAGPRCSFRRKEKCLHEPVDSFARRSYHAKATVATSTFPAS